MANLIRIIPGPTDTRKQLRGQCWEPARANRIHPELPPQAISHANPTVASRQFPISESTFRVTPQLHPRFLSLACDRRAPRTFASKIATFPMHKRTGSRSGGPQPAVVRETHLQRRYCTCSVDCRPACWRTPLRLRFRNARGLRPPRSCWRVFGRRRNCDFCDAQTHMHRSGGREPTVANGQRTCKGASAIARQTVDGALVHAVAIAFVRPRGAYASRCCSCAVRPPTDLRLLRCANAHTQERRASARRAVANRMAGTITYIFGNARPSQRQERRVSARRRGWATHLQRRYRDCSEDCRRCVGARYCNRVAVTTGGLRPPLLFARRSPADGIAAFAMHKRTRTRSGGCQSAVRRADALAKALPQMLGRLQPSVLADAVAMAFV